MPDYAMLVLAIAVVVSPAFPFSDSSMDDVIDLEALHIVFRRKGRKSGQDPVRIPATRAALSAALSDPMACKGLCRAGRI
jgi:hypothetical protein